MKANGHRQLVLHTDSWYCLPIIEHNALLVRSICDVRGSEIPFMEGHTADRYVALKLGFISITVVLMVAFSISVTASYFGVDIYLMSSLFLCFSLW